ncbi:MAG TPA: LacI family DNA-binding transcriptional regulator [Nakamurella sp.]
MAKGPTVYDVAERAGVSIATVSFAFRRPERVKASTRELVLAVAQELGYVPSASARGLAHGHTRALGLFSFDYLLDLPDHQPPADGADLDGTRAAPNPDPNEDFRLFPLYVDEVQRGVELECWRRGYALMICGRGRGDADTVIADIAGRVDGLAVFPHTVPAETLRRIAGRMPVVELSAANQDELNHVTIDNAAGMRAVTDHLITAHHLTNLGFLGDTTGSDQQARFQGFRAALRAAGLRVPRKSLSPLGSTVRDTSAIVGTLLARRGLPQALVCVTDQDALAAMDALRLAGVVVPHDVAVVGFDGIAAGRIGHPTLTTVRQPMEQMGREVVDILIDRLDHPELPPARRRLPTRVVLRESCGCPQR